MSYKYKYILLLFFSVLFSQSNFNRLLGENIFYGDARSMGIGNTFITTSNSSNLVLSNPSKISTLPNNFMIYGQFNGRFNNERKGIIVKDFFDDVITEADFVFNQNTFYNTSFGGTFNRPITDNVRFGLAFANIPLVSFDYDYVEEVRGEDDGPDNFIGSADPLIGYQVLKTEGEIILNSIGMSISSSHLDNGTVSIGVGVNKIMPSKMKDLAYVDTVNVTQDLSNLSNLEPFINIFDIKAEKEYFLSYSITLPILKDVDAIFSYEEDIDISSTNYLDYQISPYLGVPTMFEFDDNDKLKYLIYGLHYNKPEKHSIGMTYQPRSPNQILITFEASSKKMKYYLSQWNCSNVQGEQSICDDSYNEAFLENIIKKEKLFEFKLGFEHLLHDGFPIRAGFQYTENAFNFDATSIFTLGTGKNFNTTYGSSNSIDFAINYTMNDYRYYDIFPIQTDVFDNVCLDDVKCNNVKESQLSFLTTFKIGF